MLVRAHLLLAGERLRNPPRTQGARRGAGRSAHQGGGRRSRAHLLQLHPEFRAGRLPRTPGGAVVAECGVRSAFRADSGEGREIPHFHRGCRGAARILQAHLRCHIRTCPSRRRHPGGAGRLHRPRQHDEAGDTADAGPAGTETHNHRLERAAHPLSRLLRNRHVHPRRAGGVPRARQPAWQFGGCGFTAG